MLGPLCQTCMRKRQHGSQHPSSSHTMVHPSAVRAVGDAQPHLQLTSKTSTSSPAGCLHVVHVMRGAPRVAQRRRVCLSHTPSPQRRQHSSPTWLGQPTWHSSTMGRHRGVGPTAIFHIKSKGSRSGHAAPHAISARARTASTVSWGAAAVARMAIAIRRAPPVLPAPTLIHDSTGANAVAR